MKAFLCRISLSNVSLAVGIGFLFAGRTAPFIAGVCLCGISMLITHWQTALAMEGAQEAGMQQLEREHTESVAILQKRVDVLAAKVNEIELPRRDEALRRVTGSKA